MHEVLERLLARQDLTRGEARLLGEAIFTGEVPDALIAGLAVALAMKGETVPELVGFAEAMRAQAAEIGLATPRRACVDTCGTGGNPRPVLNISTAAAFVVAGAGLTVAKHGNRTSTSVCGSADVLEELGVNLELPARFLGGCLEEVGIAFLYAPLLHGAMRYAMPARRALRVRTIFNLLGPLTNPAGADAQVVGVSAVELIAKMAGALQALGTRHSFVVRSQDGLGEFSTTAVNEVAEVRSGEITAYTLDARDLGLARANIADLVCTGKAQAVAAMKSVLDGQPGPLRDIVGLNAAAALVAGAGAANLEDGLALAWESLDSGAARAKMAALVAYTHGQAAGTGAAS